MQIQAVKRKYVKKLRAPLLDEGRICQAPSCGKLFFKRDSEMPSRYAERNTCGGACAGEFQGMKKSMGAAYVDARLITCANCAWVGEDSDIGRHCRVCEAGDMFRREPMKPTIIEIELEDTPHAGSHEIKVYVQPAEPDVGIMSAFVECWEPVNRLEFLGITSEFTEEELEQIEQQVTSWWEDR
jgi:hypothetical protein